MARPTIPNVPQRVKETLDRDGVAQQAIARGIINYRALARWIIKQAELDASEDAVLSALRRLAPPRALPPFDNAYRVVAASHLNVRSGVAQLRTARNRQVQERLVQVVRHIDFEKGEILYYTQGEGGVKILVDAANLERVRQTLHGLITDVTKDLAALSVVQPASGLTTPGILALLSHTLALQRINVVDAVFGPPEYIFFLRQEDTLRAFQALEALIGMARATAASVPV